MIQHKSSSLLSEDVISQKIDIYISARKLTDLDIIGSTNSYLVVHLLEPNIPKRQVLKTKVYNNDLNPNYAENLTLDFTFEIRQKLIFEIYHNSKPPKLIGRLETTVGEIFGSPTNGFIKSITDEKDGEKGKIVIRCQKIEKGKRKTFSGQVRASGLPNLTWWWFFGGTNPFFRIYRKRKSDELLIYESEVLNKTTNPSWAKFKLLEQKLSKNSDATEIQFRFYNHSPNGNHTLIGSSTVTLARLGENRQFPILDVSNDKKGMLIFDEAKRTIKHEFGDYIENGLQLALVTCIDFTASNGNPLSPGSLHYSTTAKGSLYEQAMSEVLNILMDYDYDKLVPCFGFGAQIYHPVMNSGGKVHHCFPINFSEDNPNIYQKEAILKTYRNVFKHIKFSGPTKFSQLLKEAMEECRGFQKNQFKSEYMILFILTDGEIHDKAEVIDLLVECNRLPLSLIIVGIGNGDFTIMHELDDDDCQMVDSNGNKTERDLVQFVEFRKFKNNGIELARQVLYELPRQVEEYFELMGIEPMEMKRRKNDIEEQKQLLKERQSD